MMNNTNRLCVCGCGGTVGMGKRFIAYHHLRKNPIVGRIFHYFGYPLTYMSEHLRADTKGYVREHMLIMEKSLGRPILKSEAIHHIDGDVTNNFLLAILCFSSLT